MSMRHPDREQQVVHAWGTTITLSTAAALAVCCAAIALIPDVSQGASLERLHVRELRQQRTLHRYTGTIRFFARMPRAAHTREGRRATRRARVWVRVIRRELGETRLERRQHLAARRTLQSTGGVGYWASRQIAAAYVIGSESGGDPWPNCPDPFDGGGTWDTTVACENGGSWYDSAGYYRCGLQFDPVWERRFGRLCP